jgi:hypothetical protein
MRTLALMLLAFDLSAMAQVRAVPQEAKALLAPILDTWRKWKSDPTCVAADAQKDYCSHLHNQRDSQILTVSHTKGAAADEAIAALFSFGVRQDEGDQGHDLICLAAARGSGMTKALRKYRSCTLDISAEYPSSMRSETTVCQRAVDKAIDVIRTHSADKICAWD